MLQNLSLHMSSDPIGVAITLRGPLNIPQTCSPDPISLQFMVDFYVQKLILVALTANFQKHHEIFRVLFCLRQKSSHG